MRQAALLFAVLFPLSLSAQFQFQFDKTIQVQANGKVLKHPWAGGLNSGQYNTIKINRDDQEDLVIFDRTTNEPLIFIANQGDYVHSPESAYLLPKELNGWVLFRDYDCDGRKDIFTNSPFGIKVFRNTTGPDDDLSWKLVKNPISTKGFVDHPINLLVNVTDIPGISDIDGDGDLDILTYDFATGGYIEFHRNLSMENFDHCDSLVYERVTKEWGDFQECLCDQFAFGDNDCASAGRILHAGGKSILTFDNDGDNDQEVLIGQEQCEPLYYLENVGDRDSALFRSYSKTFPKAEKPIAFPFFPAGYIEDIDFDGRKDLLVAPNTFDNPNDQIDFIHSSWLYKNIGANTIPDFVYVENDFLQKEMIDVGEEAAPAFTDFDRDGDLDMFIGTRGKMTDLKLEGTIYLFENTGSVTNPAFQLIDGDYLNLSNLNLLGIKTQFIDLNNDNAEDLVFTGTPPGKFDANIYIIINNSPSNEAVSLNPSQAIKLNLSINKNDVPFFFDVNIDKNPDLLIGKQRGSLEFYVNNGGELADAFELEDNMYAGVGSNTLRRNLAPFMTDINQDRKPELITIDDSGEIKIYTDLFNFQFDPEAFQTKVIANSLLEKSHVAQFGHKNHLAFADLNGDNFADMVVGTSSGGVFFLRGNDQLVTGIPERGEKLNLFKIYPNPSNGDDITIISKDQISIEVYNTIGQLQIRKSYISKDVATKLDVSGLKEGIYLIRAYNENHRESKRLIIQR